MSRVCICHPGALDGKHRFDNIRDAIDYLKSKKEIEIGDYVVVDKKSRFFTACKPEFFIEWYKYKPIDIQYAMTVATHYMYFDNLENLSLSMSFLVVGEYNDIYILEGSKKRIYVVEKNGCSLIKED